MSTNGSEMSTDGGNTGKAEFAARHRSRLTGLAARFVLLVILPLAVVAAYLFFVASDRYGSETRFTVRDSGSSAGSDSLDIAMILTGGGSSARQDAYVIRDYILSPDLLGRLDAVLGVRAAWSNQDIDFVWRLAGDASEEDFLEYYRDMVAVTFNTETSIVIVELQSFEAAGTQHMLQMILAESEQLVNEISNRLARDQLDFINDEIDDNMSRLKQSKAVLLTFQNEFEVVDPREVAGLVTSVIAQMEASLAEDRAELMALGSYLDRGAPEIMSLRSRIAAKVKQIKLEKTRLTGGGNSRLNKIMARYEELRFDVEFASERYRLALLSLEKAQLDASKKVKSLVVVSRPNLPDEAIYPDRVYILATVGAFLLMGFGILSVIFAVIREHLA